MLRWLLGKKHPADVQEYLDATPRRLGNKEAVEELRFVVLDAEATGFDVSVDRILSLATIPVRQREMSVSLMRNWLVFQNTAAVNEAAKIHGILPSDTKTGEPEHVVMRELMHELKGSVIVGHHIAFDAALIDQAFRRHLGIGLRNPLVDTAILAQYAVDAFAKTGYANQHPPTLDEVCSHLEIATLERHTAEGDAFTTAELFLVLCGRLKKQLKRPLVLNDLPVERR